MDVSDVFTDAGNPKPSKASTPEARAALAASECEIRLHFRVVR